VTHLQRYISTSKALVTTFDSKRLHSFRWEKISVSFCFDLIKVLSGSCSTTSQGLHITWHRGGKVSKVVSLRSIVVRYQASDVLSERHQQCAKTWYFNLALSSSSDIRPSLAFPKNENKKNWKDKTNVPETASNALLTAAFVVLTTSIGWYPAHDWRFRLSLPLHVWTYFAFTSFFSSAMAPIRHCRWLQRRSCCFLHNFSLLRLAPERQGTDVWWQRESVIEP